MTQEQLATNVYNLLVKKEDFFSSLLKMTQAVSFENRVEDVDVISTFYSDRQELINQIEKVDQMIGTCEATISKEKAKEISTILTKNDQKKKAIKKMASEIIDIDKKNHEKVKSLRDSIAKEIKDTTVSKKAAAQYVTNYLREDGVFFDTKK